MQKRNLLNSPRLLELKKKRRRIFINKILLSTFSLLVIFTSLAYFSRISAFNINSVEIQGNKVIDIETIKSVVDKDLTGNYLGFFPRTNFLIYPKSKIKKELTDQFKIIKDISINLKNLQTLSVNIEEREGKYTWCGNDLPTQTEQNQCYFMDDKGYIFGEAPYFSGNVYLKFFGQADLGLNFFPDIFSKLVSFDQSVEAMGIKTSSFLVKDDKTIELYLLSDTPPPLGPKIVLKTDSDFEKVTENLQTALSTEPLQTEFKNKYSTLQYIYLQFGNKVYYKFSTQNESVSPVK